uniref:Uncharacterized protein n=1 Tax=Magallana gigas TaxID=29159 RepID=K1R3U0_MAGGI
MKQTWLSSPFDGSSDKAVDGRFTSRSISDQQCTISQPNATITWWVNIGKVYMIDHIVMYFRTENLEWGINNGYTAAFLGFSLYISNTTEKEDGILCHHDTTYTRQTIPDHVSIECPYHGQYVIFYNERLPGVTYPSGYSSKAYGDLCEVEVYGCPSPVADISQCSNPCPENCEECFPGTGYCIRCKRGFEGIACEMGNESTNTPRKGTRTRSPVMGTIKNTPFRGTRKSPVQGTRNNTDIGVRSSSESPERERLRTKCKRKYKESSDESSDNLSSSESNNSSDSNSGLDSDTNFDPSSIIEKGSKVPKKITKYIAKYANQGISKKIRQEVTKN